ncbi:hypothetical protein ACPESR_25315 [Nocardia testacea]
MSDTTPTPTVGVGLTVQAAVVVTRAADTTSSDPETSEGDE